MCKIETILFDVEKKSTTEIGYGGTAGRNAVVIGEIDGVPHLLNLCSQNYELINNKLVFPEIENMLNDMGVEFTACYSHRNFTRFYADYNLNLEGLTIGGGTDKIVPQIHVEHSYDSSLKFKMELGFHRLVCSNGLTMPISEKELKKAGYSSVSISRKHSFENMQKSFSDFKIFMKELLDGDVFKTASKKYEVLFDTKVEKLNERILEVISVTGVFDKKLVSVAEGLVNYEAKLLKTEPNEWLVYNAINSLIFDNEVNSKSIEERRKMDARVFETIEAQVLRN